MIRRRLAVLVLAVVAACGGQGGEASRVEVEGAFTSEGTQALAVYLDIANDGGADEIVGAQVLAPDDDLADDVTLHQATERDGLSIMEPTDAIAIPAHGHLDPRHAHVMLEGIDEDLEAGRTLRLRLELHGGSRPVVVVRVVSADEAVALLLGEGPT